MYCLEVKSEWFLIKLNEVIDLKGTVYMRIMLASVIYEDIMLVGSHVRHLTCKSSRQRINL